jgi:hypothetical protein
VRLVVTPLAARAGELVHVAVEGAPADHIGGLKSTVRNLNDEVVAFSVADPDLGDAAVFWPDESFNVYMSGVWAASPVPVRLPAVPPGGYKIEREFQGDQLDIAPIPADWQGDPEDHPSSSAPTRATYRLTVSVTVTSP